MSQPRAPRAFAPHSKQHDAREHAHVRPAKEANLVCCCHGAIGVQSSREIIENCVYTMKAGLAPLVLELPVLELPDMTTTPTCNESDRRAIMYGESSSFCSMTETPNRQYEARGQGGWYYHRTCHRLLFRQVV